MLNPREFLSVTFTRPLLPIKTFKAPYSTTNSLSEWQTRPPKTTWLQKTPSSVKQCLQWLTLLKHIHKIWTIGLNFIISLLSIYKNHRRWNYKMIHHSSPLITNLAKLIRDQFKHIDITKTSWAISTCYIRINLRHSIWNICQH